MSVAQVRYRRRDWFYWLCRILYVLIGLMGILIALGAFVVDMVVVSAIDPEASLPEKAYNWWIKQSEWYYVKIIGAALAITLFAKYAPFVREKIPIDDSEPEDETRYWPLLPLLCFAGLLAWFVFYKREDAAAILELFLKR